MSKWGSQHIKMIHERLYTLREEGLESLSLSNLARATSLICEVKERRVFQAKKECNRESRTPRRSCQNLSGKKRKLSEKIVNEVMAYCEAAQREGTPVTWKELASFVNERNHEGLSRQTVCRDLKKNGFVKGRTKKQVIVSNFQVSRRDLLYKLIRCNYSGRKKNRKKLVFLDESYVNIHHKSKETVFHISTGGFSSQPSGSGDRYIIIGAGSKDGWVDNSIEIWRAKKSSGDYHGNMNSKIFMRWFEKNLLPNLLTPSIILMDNARYHKCLDEDFALERTPSKMTKPQLQKYLSDQKFRIVMKKS